MGDVNGAYGNQPLKQNEINHYKEDYQKSLELFQNALEEYSHPDGEFHKKEQLKKVMNEALQVMNETASVALKESKGQKLVVVDYQAYLDDPSDKNKRQLTKDLENLH
jgi:hypothetical protein